MNHWLVLLVCVVFWGRPPGAFPYFPYLLILFNLYIFVCVHIYAIQIYIHTHFYIHVCFLIPSGIQNIRFVCTHVLTNGDPCF